MAELSIGRVLGSAAKDLQQFPIAVDVNGIQYARNAAVAGTATAYRTALTAADVVAVPGTVTCTLQAGGGAPAGVYNVKVVAGNIYGRTTAKAGNATVTTAGGNLTVRAAFAAVTGATYYDIYVSTDADPKWVGRITEAQRASGILITAVGVTGAGGATGAVDVQVAGTGNQSNTTAAMNTAYVLPAGVDCTNAQYVDFDVACARLAGFEDAVGFASTLVVIPFLFDATSASWFAGAKQTLTFGGASGVYEGLQQRLRVEARGCSAVALVVANIAGITVNVWTVLS